MLINWIFSIGHNLLETYFSIGLEEEAKKKRKKSHALVLYIFINWFLLSLVYLHQLERNISVGIDRDTIDSCRTVVSLATDGHSTAILSICRDIFNVVRRPAIVASVDDIVLGASADAVVVTVERDFTIRRRIEVAQKDGTAISIDRPGSCKNALQTGQNDGDRNGNGELHLEWQNIANAKTTADVRPMCSFYMPCSLLSVSITH